MGGFSFFRYEPFKDGSRAPGMKESQHTEWKESWRDDHLRWICGFANADGGVLVIGRNDKGRVVGLADAGEVTMEVTMEVTTEVRLLRAH